jgi:hypothetical protein
MKNSFKNNCQEECIAVMMCNYCQLWEVKFMCAIEKEMLLKCVPHMYILGHRVWMGELLIFGRLDKVCMVVIGPEPF